MSERERKALEGLRQDKETLQHLTNLVAESEQKKRYSTRLGDGWTIYDSGALGPMGYFGDGEGGFGELIPFASVKAETQARTKEGKKVLMLDIMGQCRVGVDLGATKSVGWTYQDQGEEKLPGRVIETGDLMNKEVVTSHFEKLEKDIQEGYELTDVFFRPEGGSGVYSDNTYAFAHLYENILRRVYAIAPIGTRFYFSMLYSASSGYGLMEALKTEGFALQQARSPLYLLTKTAETPELPSLRTLVKTYDLEQEYPYGRQSE